MSSPKCVVVDYGIGNVFSVVHALKQCGAEPELTGDLDRVRTAERVVLPGVGAFGRAAERLRELNLDGALRDFVATGRPFLGICVGLQLLMETGEEFGIHQGLGFLPGTVKRIDVKHEDETPVRVPVIGWNRLVEPSPGQWENSCLARIPSESAFYFVHSYAVNPTKQSDVLALARVGSDHVVAAVQRDNVLGVQFHPERSADSGIELLTAFLSS